MKRSFPSARFALMLVAASVLLSGCTMTQDWFTQDSEPPLKGERISILQLQKDLVPDAALANTPIELPELWANEMWPQTGGYPTHAMGNLALPAKIKKAWSVSVGEGGDYRNALTAPPIVAEGMVYTLDARANVSAFTLQDGKKKWELSVVPPNEEGVGALGGGVAYADGKIFVTAGYRSLVALDAQTGKLLWRVETASPGRAAPTVIDGMVSIVTMDNRLLVFGASNGSLIWKYNGVAETTNLLGAATAAADSSIIVLPLSSGDLFGLNAPDGKIMWQDNLSAVRRSGPMSSIADIRGLPVIDRGIVFAVSYSGRMVALDQFSGQRIWQRELGSGQTPWSAGGGVFVVSTEQTLVGMSREKGEVHWVTPLAKFEGKDREKTVVWSGPVMAGGRLILVSSAGEMISVDPSNGKIINTETFKSGSMISPVVSNGTLLILTQTGELIAYR